MGVLGVSFAAVAAYAGLVTAAVSAQRLLVFPWWLDGRRMPESGIIDRFEKVEIVACDGTRISALWLPPQPGSPVMLTFHGRQGLHWVNAIRFAKGQWSSSGFGVLAPAFRGYHGSAGRPDERGLLLDAEASLHFVQKAAPGSLIYIHGHSLGSAVAAGTAARFPCEMLILESPFTSLPEVGARWFPFLPVRRYLRDVFPTAKLIRQAKAKTVVVIHGTRDRLVPFAMGKAVAGARKGSHFLSLEGSGHTGFQDRADKLLLPLLPLYR